MFFAAALMVVPAAGAWSGNRSVRGICNGIYRMYRPAMEKMNLEEEKKDYHLAECEWDEKTPDTRWKNKEECERRIHYFKGVKDKEELEKRLSGLLRIYRRKEFAEDALTRSIFDEFEYLKGRLEKDEDIRCLMEIWILIWNIWEKSIRLLRRELMKWWKLYMGYQSFTNLQIPAAIFANNIFDRIAII